MEFSLPAELSKMIKAIRKAVGGQPNPMRKSIEGGGALGLASAHWILVCFRKLEPRVAQILVNAKAMDFLFCARHLSSTSLRRRAIFLPAAFRRHFRHQSRIRCRPGHVGTSRYGTHCLISRQYPTWYRVSVWLGRTGSEVHVESLAWVVSRAAKSSSGRRGHRGSRDAGKLVCRAQPASSFHQQSSIIRKRLIPLTHPDQHIVVQRDGVEGPAGNEESVSGLYFG